MLFNAKNQILKNARVQSCGYDGPAWATRRVDPITGIPMLAWPKRGTAVDPLEGDQPHVRNCLRGRLAKRAGVGGAERPPYAEPKKKAGQA